MTEDKILSISTSLSIRPEDVAHKSFNVVKRGYDPDQIRVYLEQIANEFAHLLERENRLRQQIHDMQATQDKPAEIDEETITKILGQETAKILSSAREAARDLLARTSSEAAEIKAQAQKIMEQKLKEAEDEKWSIIESANRNSKQMAEDAETEKQALLAEVKEKCRLMVNEAQIARERILGELIRKRRVLNTQVEQLRTGKDVILESLTKVKDDVENLSDTLIHIEQEAKYAAEQSALRVSLEDDPTESELITISEKLESGKINFEPSTRKQPSITRLTAQVEKVQKGPAVSIDKIDITDKIAQEMLHQADDDDDDGLRIIGIEEVNGHKSFGIQTDDKDELQIVENSEIIDQADIAGEKKATNRTDVSDSNTKSSEADNNSLSETLNNNDKDAEFENSTQFSNDVANNDSAFNDRDYKDSESGVYNEETDQGSSAKVDDLFKQLKGTQLKEVSTTESPAMTATTAKTEPPEINANLASDIITIDEAADSSNESMTSSSEVIKDDFETSAKELIEGLVVNLIRKVKRAITDEQNELLDGLRKLKHSSLDTILNKQLQSSNYYEVISPILIQAEIAGKEFAKTMASNTEIDTVETPVTNYQKLSDEMSNLVTSSLRQKVSFELQIKSDEEKNRISEELGSSYREWKNEKIESVASDFIYSSFNSGIFSSFKNGTTLSWLFTTDEPECPDCQDNVLQKKQNVGEVWPTGQMHPPAHPGCRCILTVDIG